MVMSHISATDFIGYLAATLVLTTFYLRTMLRMRMVAICSNIAFITYGALAGVLPLLVLHSLLLPLNSIRLLQLLKLVKRVGAQTSDESVMSLLVPFMKLKKLPRGATLFKEGDPAEVLYYVIEGELSTCVHDAKMGPGSVVGEIGIFSPAHKRSDTVICQTDAELASISAGTIWELIYQHPALGAHLIRIIAQRAAQPIPISPKPE
jgi:hypothetical protein